MGTLAGRFVALCWAIFCVVWFVAAFRTKRTMVRHGPRPLWWFVVLIAILVFRLMARPGTGLFLIGRWSPTPAIGILADVITLAGLLVALWARVMLGANWSWEVVFKEDHAVVERGPYQYVRHPIYTGVLLMALGTMVLWASLMAAMWFAAAFAGVWLKLRAEEHLLTRHLPDAYARYRSRVKWALIPFVL